MITLFVQNVGASISSVYAFILPWLQYYLTNPILGFSFVTFVIFGFVRILLSIKNIFSEGIKP